MKLGIGLVAALLTASALGHSAWGQQAFLRADGNGQAMLRARGDRCYAITPQHVMGQETAALLTARGRERGEADLRRRIPAAPEPMLLLTVRGLPASVCPPFEGAEPLDALLSGSSAATLRLVQQDGSVEFVPLTIRSVETETFEVRAGETRLAQGMSGGTILMQERPIGILTDVQEGGTIGRAARMDRVFERVSPHLASAPPVETPRASAGSMPYEVVRSNAEPVSPENRISSLQGDGAGPWRVVAQGRVEIVAKLSGVVGQVSLDVGDVADPPRSVELLAGRSETGPWQSMATLTLEPGDGKVERRFVPTRLSYILLRMGVASGQRTAALRRVSFYPP